MVTSGPPLVVAIEQEADVEGGAVIWEEEEEGEGRRRGRENKLIGGSMAEE